MLFDCIGRLSRDPLSATKGCNLAVHLDDFFFPFQNSVIAMGRARRGSTVVVREWTLKPSRQVEGADVSVDGECVSADH
jgi:hypothetical protein